jgi:type I restriction enzyme M protein
LFIDASQLIKGENPKRINARHIKIISSLWKIKTEEDKYSHLAPLSEVETNDYNLNIPVVDTFEEEKKPLI